MMEKEGESNFHCTDIEAIKDNTEKAVDDFAQRYLSMPRFTERCEAMDQAQLRDAMGLRSTFEAGDPWPAAEKLLLERGFRWHMLGGMRVMYVMEREDMIPSELDGWADAEEVVDNC